MLHRNWQIIGVLVMKVLVAESMRVYSKGRRPLSVPRCRQPLRRVLEKLLVAPVVKKSHAQYPFLTAQL
jgi:hypothetical protein